MGQAKRTRERRKRLRKSPLPQGMPPECWNVRGASQHGEELSFDTTSAEEACRHAERLNALGGRVAVRRMVWASNRAAYVYPKSQP